jgi:hypothetical protein
MPHLFLASSRVTLKPDGNRISYQDAALPATLIESRSMSSIAARRGFTLVELLVKREYSEFQPIVAIRLITGRQWQTRYGKRRMDASSIGARVQITLRKTG